MPVLIAASQTADDMLSSDIRCRLYRGHWSNYGHSQDRRYDGYRRCRRRCPSWWACCLLYSHVLLLVDYWAKTT